MTTNKTKDLKIVQGIAGILNKPFPEEESRFGTPMVIALVSLFVIFVLYVFQPFGISSIESNKFLICLGFGITTFLSTIIYEFIVGQLFKLKGKREQWTFGKWIINNLGIMFSISLGNFLFARLLIFGYIQWDLFPYMLYATFMIGIVPIIVLGAWALMSQERKYQYIAEEINHQKPDGPTSDPVEEKSIFDIPLTRIRFVEALQNYVKIGYVNPQGQFTTRTERATLKHILQETQGSTIVRSHRSFLVNKKEIISSTGNAQGLLLTVNNCETFIPVSRSYINSFREKK